MRTGRTVVLGLNQPIEAGERRRATVMTSWPFIVNRIVIPSSKVMARLMIHDMGWKGLRSLKDVCRASVLPLPVEVLPLLPTVSAQVWGGDPQLREAFFDVENPTKRAIAFRAGLVGEVDMPDANQCGTCGHTLDEHRLERCWGLPYAPELDAGGECPCLGFEKRANPN
jgi:hypothetical protein